MQDFYEILGVSRSSTDDEIKKAYRALARQFHPDANPGDAAAEARFKEVSVAYETLRDPEKRRRYDTFGPEGLGAAAGFGGADFGLNDLFDAFFGGDAFGRGRGPAGPPRGQDAETVIELTLVEAAFGVTRSLDLTMPVECETCGGSGAAEGTHAETCPTCGGRGEVHQTRRSILGQLVTSGPCPQCGGLGTVVPSPCPDVPGRGTSPRLPRARRRGSPRDRRRPATAADGSRSGRAARRGPRRPLRERSGRSPIRGSNGAATIFSSCAGSRSPRPRWEPSSRSRRSTDTEPLVVAPGTQPGAVTAASAAGVCRRCARGRRGDLIVQLDVEIPTNLSAEEAELLVQFAELRGESVTSPKDHGLFSRIRSAFQ